MSRRVIALGAGALGDGQLSDGQLGDGHLGMANGIAARGDYWRLLPSTVRKDDGGRGSIVGGSGEAER